MKAPQQTETASPTPEQLFQLLDLQLAQERTKREGRSRKRAMILVFGILAIVAGASIALFIAQQMLLDLHHRAGTLPPAGETTVIAEKL